MNQVKNRLQALGLVDRAIASTTDDELAAVRLHLTHEGFDSADSVMLHRVSEGWPKIVSALKTWLESPKAPQE